MCSNLCIGLKDCFQSICHKLCPSFIKHHHQEDNQILNIIQREHAISVFLLLLNSYKQPPQQTPQPPQTKLQQIIINIYQ